MGKEKQEVAQEGLDVKYDLCIENLEDAREGFLQLDGVIGIGYGPREKEGEILEDEPCFILYVEEKKDKKTLSPKELIPSDFRGVPIDVVVPGHRSDSSYDEYDSSWLDPGKIHASNPQAEVNLVPMVDYDLDHVALLEIDNTFLSGNRIDFAKATKRFLNSHPDAFDFITFYVDTSTGLPGQGSFHSGVYNKTKGLNYYAGSNLDNRSAFGSTKLQAYHSIGWIGNYVLLQETGHMWGAFVRNRDRSASPRRYDLLMGSSGQGKFHWGRHFDNDHSPMDYDGIDWQALAGNRFRSHGIGDDYFHFCPLDLYLMGLISPSQVGSFYVIKNPSANSGTITGNRKNLSVKNVVWAEGARSPAYPSAQKVWKQAFVVLTKNARTSRSFAANVAKQRREFTWQFFKGTRYLGKVDTTLRSYTSSPAIRDVSVASDNDRAIVGWKSRSRTKGQVNFSLSSRSFRRDQAHTEPFTTVRESSFRASHGVLLTGLIPNRTYYFEIIEETPEGLIDRNGVGQIYTRKTNDACKPDINNVSIRRIGRNKVTITWKTDELSDSRVYYGKTTPPTGRRYDPYPTTKHSLTLTGLSAGTYYFRIESRDAAWNVCRDDNGGRYYRVVVPARARLLTKSVSPEDISQRIEEINLMVESGDNSSAVEQTSHLIAHVAEKELGQIVEEMTLPEDDMEAGCVALETLVSRLEGSVQIVEQGEDFIDLSVEGDPLSTMSCVNLPEEIVAEECGYPLLSDLISIVRPGLTLEPHPNLGTGHYRLKKV